ncbi:MAG: VWA domain-containing protein [Candidatus Marinimicrobia bacterium]|nr:VWA domain-containing protein [Candidatus Neomarinimicrobiota bacterium]
MFWRKKNSNHETLRIGTIIPIKNISQNINIKTQLPVLLRFLTMSLIIFALARPQLGDVTQNIKKKGIDIILALDISGSMQIEDFKPNRLEASKKVAMEFIQGRKTDRIGLVVFAGESFLQCPLTVDYDVLTNIVSEMKIIPRELDGTAIGLAISNSINRLRDSQAESKVVILLSDGDNNAGDIDPITATKFAKEFDIKIYTIAMGGDGGNLGNSFFSFQRVPPVNEKLLKKIAELTGGQFFKANSNEKLKDIWNEISKMEKTEINVEKYTDWDEKYLWFLFPAILLFLIELLLSRIIWRIYP